MTNTMSYSDVNSYFGFDTLFSKASDGYNNYRYNIRVNNDFDTIKISSVKCGDVLLTFKQPFFVEIKKDFFDGEEVFIAVNKDFYIDVYDDSVENLRLAVEDNICFLWMTYAEAEDSCLTDRAIKIKKKLLNAIMVS